MFKINKKLLFLIIALLLIFFSVAYAEVCEVDKVKQVLRKALYLHFIDPKSDQLTLNEIKDLLVFYLSISEGSVTIDCSSLGSNSNKLISDIVNAGNNTPDKIPTCSDGTKYGECSTFKPKYCYSGSLVHRCNYCGCPSPSSCTTGGKCETVTNQTNQTCIDSDDGKNYFVKGSATGYYFNDAYGTFTDYCRSVKPDGSDPNWVLEYHCESAGSTQQGRTPYISTSSYYCANGCKDGACLSCTENWQCDSWSSCSNGNQSRTCTDSNNCGTTTNRPALTQSCTSTPPTCTDSDDADYYVKGNTIGNLFLGNCKINQTVGNYQDYCYDSSYIMEYYCDNGPRPGCSNLGGKNYVSLISAFCVNGCKDGACKNATSSVPSINATPSCVETDCGWDWYTRGSITISGTVTEDGEYTDYCYGNRLIEYRCNKDKNGQLLAIALQWGGIICRNGCKDGACIFGPLWDDGLAWCNGGGPAPNPAVTSNPYAN